MNNLNNQTVELGGESNFKNSSLAVSKSEAANLSVPPPVISVMSSLADRRLKRQSDPIKPLLDGLSDKENIHSRPSLTPNKVFQTKSIIKKTGPGSCVFHFDLC